MMLPAYDYVEGSYPKSENDIMLSRRLLEQLGILEPKIGMKIPVRILFKNWAGNGGEAPTEEFTLSGYYTDYINGARYVPTAYFAEKYMDMKEIPRFPAKLVFTVKSKFFSRDQLEKRLYQDIELDNAQQQFTATDSSGLKSVTQFWEVMGRH